MRFLTDAGTAEGTFSVHTRWQRRHCTRRSVWLRQINVEPNGRASRSQPFPRPLVGRISLLRVVHRLGPSLEDKPLGSRQADSGPTQLVVEHNFYNRGPEAQGKAYGKIILLQHSTGKDATEKHPLGYVWYDSVIVSREMIPPAL